jgi:hypothetical protein
VGDLTIRGDAWRVDLPELSALAVRGGDAGRLELLGVGDKSFSIFAGEAQPPGTGRVSGDLAEQVRRWPSERKASQWEGLAADGAGRAFVLQEHADNAEQPSHVFVFAPDLHELVCVIALAVKGHGAEWKDAWSEHKNARGEALVLLRSGHLLVAKQKDPVRFVEFGPKGSRAAGVGASRFLDEGEPFECPSEPFVEYESLGSWGVTRQDRDELPAVNDLAVFEGRLYAVSRESHRIARLETPEGPDEEDVAVGRSWPVPAAVGHPEGLVLRDGLVPIVADDLSADEDKGGPNIFLLSHLS